MSALSMPAWRHSSAKDDLAITTAESWSNEQPEALVDWVISQPPGSNLIALDSFHSGVENYFLSLEQKFLIFIFFYLRILCCQSFQLHHLGFTDNLIHHSKSLLPCTSNKTTFFTGKKQNQSVEQYRYACWLYLYPLSPKQLSSITNGLLETQRANEKSHSAGLSYILCGVCSPSVRNMVPGTNKR